MKIERFDLIIVGAGPSGLSAAIEASKRGMNVVVFDENARPGGQLFKQIHKFFGSKEHKAKIRGFHIGEQLLTEASEAGVKVELNATVIGLYQDREVVVRMGDEVHHFKGDAIIIATGAAENMVLFDGWNLPGVMGAGAAQTLLNLYGVKPGEKILMLGTGNVGLVVAFQLIQCGCDVVALVDAAPKIGGYGVHAAKVARTEVPFYLSHTIKKVEGEDHVTGVTIGEIDDHFQFIEGTDKHFDVDTVCVAVGLSPMSQLLKMAGCKMEDNPRRGGQVPIVGDYGETSGPGIYSAGDVSGIEEASSAMIEGRMSGIAAAEYLGFIDKEEKEAEEQHTLSFKDMVLNRNTFQVEIAGKILPKITKQEFAILELLLRNPKQVFSKEDIFEYAWDEPYMGETKTLDVHISNIRKKIKQVTSEEYIETVWGIGYRLHA